MIPTKIYLLSTLRENIKQLIADLPRTALISVVAFELDGELIPIDDPDIELQYLLTIYEMMKKDCHDLIEERRASEAKTYTSNERKALHIASLFASARRKHCNLLITSHLHKHYNRGRYKTGVFRKNDDFKKP